MKFTMKRVRMKKYTIVSLNNIFQRIFLHESIDLLNIFTVKTLTKPCKGILKDLKPLSHNLKPYKTLA